MAWSFEWQSSPGSNVCCNEQWYRTSLELFDSGRSLLLAAVAVDRKDLEPSLFDNGIHSVRLLLVQNKYDDPVLTVVVLLQEFAQPPVLTSLVDDLNHLRDPVVCGEVG
jgi:hypothetical protein